MEENIIKVSTEDKITSIRVRETTKRMLEALAVRKETHEEIILRLIKLANNLFAEQGSLLINKGNMIGTKYQRLHKTIQIETKKQSYSVVCAYNDLTIFAMLKNANQLKNYITQKNINPEWEVDLEIVNIRYGKHDLENTRLDSPNWQNPSALKKKDINEYSLIYLVSLKKILEETFDVQFYEIITEQDYFNLEKWEKAYKANSLSMESFDSDVQKKLRQ